MLVIDENRTTAMVIRNDGFNVTLVPLKDGKLSARSISFAQFRQRWYETDYPLAKALAAFQGHVARLGASGVVVKGLIRLQNRDRWVVASLF